MKAQELRIGNLYHFADNDCIRYRTVIEIKHNEFGFQCDYDGVNFGICRPVPITEQWLLKFGFECEYSHLTNIYKYYLPNTPFGYSKYEFSVFVSTGAFSVKIEYVHQLQNLYFALTGEELTLKL